MGMIRKSPCITCKGDKRMIDIESLTDFYTFHSTKTDGDKINVAR